MIEIVRGNDFGLLVALGMIVDDSTVPIDLSGAERLRLALVGHGMHVFARDVAVKPTETHVAEGVIPGRGLLSGVYGLEVSYRLNGRDKRIFYPELFGVVEANPDDTDNTAEGEGGGIRIDIIVTPETVEVVGRRGPDGVSPVVTVEDITGGHRVTITDASGDHVYDVMDGQDGQDGFSPTVQVTKVGKVTTITITDEEGDHTATVNDGADGKDGKDGQDGAPGQTPAFSMGTVETLSPGSQATASITGTAAAPVLNLGIPSGLQGVPGQDGADGKDGQDGADGKDGQDGQDGADGYSPTVTVTDITGGHRVAITDKNGTQTFDVMDGESPGELTAADVNDIWDSVMEEEEEIGSES